MLKQNLFLYLKDHLNVQNKKSARPLVSRLYALGRYPENFNIWWKTGSESLVRLNQIWLNNSYLGNMPIWSSVMTLLACHFLSSKYCSLRPCSQKGSGLTLCSPLAPKVSVCVCFQWSNKIYNNYRKDIWFDGDH